VSQATCSRVDHLTWVKRRHWARRRHPNASAGWVYDRYWPRRDARRVFATPATPEGQVYLTSHREVPSLWHAKVAGNRGSSSLVVIQVHGSIIATSEARVATSKILVNQWRNEHSCRDQPSHHLVFTKNDEEPGCSGGVWGYILAIERSVSEGNLPYEDRGGTPCLWW
jgi:hypothetical protein